MTNRPVARNVGGSITWLVDNWPKDCLLYTHPATEIIQDWDDKHDQWTEQIKAEHPLRTNDFETHALAMEMVHNRRGKFALVALVNWLLRKAKPSGLKLVPAVISHITDLDRCVLTLKEYGLHDTAEEVDVAIKELTEALPPFYRGLRR